MVNPGLHFISGLPRSGSTLLAAILKQNPRFTAGMSSPVARSYRALEASMSREDSEAFYVTDKQRRDVLKGLFANFYEGHTGTIFDTNRMWAARLPALAKLFPDAKVICCVRDLAWILDSFERLHARNPFEVSKIYNFDTTGTVYSRVGRLSAGDGTVGYALNALREALAGEFSDRVLLVEYDDLCRNPVKELGRIYKFIGETQFAHDFKNIQYSASEFDRSISAPGLHDVSGPVEVRKRKSVLPPDIFARYTHDQFWRAA